MLFKKLFHFAACPRRTTQKSQTGFETGIALKAAYRHLLSQINPAVVIDQFSQEGFQSDALQWIRGFWLIQMAILAQNKIGLISEGLDIDAGGGIFQSCCFIRSLMRLHRREVISGGPGSGY